MVTTVISTVDVQTNVNFILDGNDRLIVSQAGSIFWDGNSSILNSLNASGVRVEIYGAVSVNSMATGESSSFFVSKTGSIVAKDGILIGGSFSASSFENHGTVQTEFASIYTYGQFSSVSNYGSLSGQTGVYLSIDHSSHARMFNSGIIYAKNEGVLMAGKYSTVENVGGILSNQTGIYVTGEWDGSSFTSTEMDISNSGEIRGLATGINAQMSVATSQLVVLNTGTIGGRFYSILSSGGSDTIVNSGLLDGNVVLGAGEDTFDTRGGTVIGTVTGGAGSDTYFTDDASLTIIETNAEVDTVNAAVSFRLASFVENLTLLGTGNFNGFGNASVNVINGNAGDNRLTGLAGNDTVNGDLGEDRLLGGGDSDSLDGGDGDDVVLGGAGTDTVRGGDGDDVINGGAGKDFLAGNLGADRFVFQSLLHSGNLTGTADTISDFVKGDDVIDVAALDAIATNAVSNDSFAFLGTAAFSAIAGQMRVSQSGGYTYVEMDVNGDSVADAMIRITGLHSLNAGDFLL